DGDLLGQAVAEGGGSLGHRDLALHGVNAVHIAGQDGDIGHAGHIQLGDLSLGDVHGDAGGLGQSVVGVIEGNLTQGHSQVAARVGRGNGTGGRNSSL